MTAPANTQDRIAALEAEVGRLTDILNQLMAARDETDEHKQIWTAKTVATSPGNYPTIGNVRAITFQDGSFNWAEGETISWQDRSGSHQSFAGVVGGPQTDIPEGTRVPVFYDAGQYYAIYAGTGEDCKFGITDQDWLCSTWNVKILEQQTIDDPSPSIDLRLPWHLIDQVQDDPNNAHQRAQVFIDADGGAVGQYDSNAKQALGHIVGGAWEWLPHCAVQVTNLDTECKFLASKMRPIQFDYDAGRDVPIPLFQDPAGIGAQTLQPFFDVSAFAGHDTGPFPRYLRVDAAGRPYWGSVSSSDTCEFMITQTDTGCGRWYQKVARQRAKQPPDVDVSWDVVAGAAGDVADLHWHPEQFAGWQGGGEFVLGYKDGIKTAFPRTECKFQLDAADGSCGYWIEKVQPLISAGRQAYDPTVRYEISAGPNKTVQLYVQATQFGGFNPGQDQVFGHLSGALFMFRPCQVKVDQDDTCGWLETKLANEAAAQNPYQIIQWHKLADPTRIEYMWNYSVLSGFSSPWPKVLHTDGSSLYWAEVGSGGGTDCKFGVTEADTNCAVWTTKVLRRDAGGTGDLPILVHYEVQAPGADERVNLYVRSDQFASFESAAEQYYGHDGGGLRAYAACQIKLDAADSCDYLKPKLANEAARPLAETIYYRELAGPPRTLEWFWAYSNISGHVAPFPRVLQSTGSGLQWAEAGQFQDTYQFKIDAVDPAAGFWDSKVESTGAFSNFAMRAGYREIVAAAKKADIFVDPQLFSGFQAGEEQYYGHNDASTVAFTAGHVKIDGNDALNYLSTKFDNQEAGTGIDVKWRLTGVAPAQAIAFWVDPADVPCLTQIDQNVDPCGDLASKLANAATPSSAYQPMGWHRVIEVGTKVEYFWDFGGHGGFTPPFPKYLYTDGNNLFWGEVQAGGTDCKFGISGADQNCAFWIDKVEGQSAGHQEWDFVVQYHVNGAGGDESAALRVPSAQFNQFDVGAEQVYGHKAGILTAFAACQVKIDLSDDCGYLGAKLANQNANTQNTVAMNWREVAAPRRVEHYWHYGQHSGFAAPWPKFLAYDGSNLVWQTVQDGGDTCQFKIQNTDTACGFWNEKIQTSGTFDPASINASWRQTGSGPDVVALFVDMKQFSQYSALSEQYYGHAEGGAPTAYAVGQVKLDATSSLRYLADHLANEAGGQGINVYWQRSGTFPNQQVSYFVRPEDLPCQVKMNAADECEYLPAKFTNNASVVTTERIYWREVNVGQGPQMEFHWPYSSLPGFSQPFPKVLHTNGSNLYWQEVQGGTEDTCQFKIRQGDGQCGYWQDKVFGEGPTLTSSDLPISWYLAAGASERVGLYMSPTIFSGFDTGQRQYFGHNGGTPWAWDACQFAVSASDQECGYWDAKVITTGTFKDSQSPLVSWEIQDIAGEQVSQFIDPAQYSGWSPNSPQYFGHDDLGLYAWPAWQTKVNDEDQPALLEDHFANRNDQVDGIPVQWKVVTNEQIDFRVDENDLPCKVRMDSSDPTCDYLETKLANQRTRTPQWKTIYWEKVGSTAYHFAEIVYRDVLTGVSWDSANARLVFTRETLPVFRGFSVLPDTTIPFTACP